MTKHSFDLESLYSEGFKEIIASAKFVLSDIKPSDWVEQNRMMGSDETSRPGPFRYEDTPYLVEIINRISPNDPAQIITVMKGAQIGFSTGVIEGAIGWIIAQSPGNILFLSGHQELSEEAMNGKIDKMIESCGLRGFIKPNVIRKKNQRTGDTAKSKEFPGGSLVAGSANNHKLLRQRSVRYGFFDDFEAVKGKSTQSGSTKSLILQRFAAYADKMKVFFISTPELKETSNIEPAFKLGDQRKWHIECPCCGEEITLEWKVEMVDNPEEFGGIIWELDENGKLIPESVKYRCQMCGDTFEERIKHDLVRRGRWIATAEPSEEGNYSYHISCLYAPAYMFGWVYYVRQYLEACPPGGKIIEDKYQAFVNLCLGETYEQKGETIEAKALQKNIRSYEIDTIPEQLSINDGNGRIVLLTCACDCNGKVDDARLDYEILAWSENDGVSYSVKHGSIGTFVPKEDSEKREDRVRWSYKPNMPNNVWKELDKVLDKIYLTDTPNPTDEEPRRIGRKIKVAITGVDTGHFTDFVYKYIDNTRHTVVGVRGDKENKYRKHNADTPSFKPAKERGKLYLIDVNYVKDNLARAMSLTWNKQFEKEQPPGFMNYPTPSNGLYLYENFFKHYESEQKVKQLEKDGTTSWLWKKKQTNLQNHFFDVRVYNSALRDITVDIIARDKSIKHMTWQQFCSMMLRK